MSWRVTPIDHRPRSSPAPLEPRGDLLAALLAARSDLTAVERFTRDYEAGDAPEQARYYRSLLPTAPPGAGQQYAFEVDLDRCSGCKACVTACHSLNGLDDGEAWRDVGLLVGGCDALPVLQHVTTTCHHCLDPACASACPVDAYVKDPLTGIVRHLDDQCFGCQYCTLACPYDVPKYHAGKGIVRKCDMCAGRLAVGEAPACVQACPHQAIRIQVVDASRVVADCEASAFLPGAPNPDHTLPTTTFKTSRPLPRNLLPADYYTVKPEHAHWALVVMLVLTQLSVGAFLVEWLMHRAGFLGASGTAAQPLFALACGLLAIAASMWHLGRPLYAFRAVIGLRHSWLSREILAFGLYAAAATAYALACWVLTDDVDLAARLRHGLGTAVVLTGLAGVLCSAMIYHVVKRPAWHLARTLPKFLLTAVLLGSAATLVMLPESRGVLWRVMLSATLAKLALESLALAALRDRQLTPLRRSALLMTGALANVTLARFAAGLFGGVLVPLLLTTPNVITGNGMMLTVSIIALLACLAGELAERYLFFAATVAPKMPGALTP